MNETVRLSEMRQGVCPVDHPTVKAGRVGVLLVNLGTPEATDYWSMRRYLKEFLSDKRVIETSRLLWWPILNLIILTKRPGPKGRDYASIWNNERNEGPLKTITRAQAADLAAHLKSIAGDKVTVDWAMRYGKPVMRERIQALLDAGMRSDPVGAALSPICGCDLGNRLRPRFRALMDMRWQPSIRCRRPTTTIPSISTPSSRR